MAEATSDVRFTMVQGEDWSCYVEWTDSMNNPVTSGAASQARMQVRLNPGSSVILDFKPDVDPEIAAAAVVLGASGLIRLSCPRTLSTPAKIGNYMCDLFVEHVDDVAQVFPNGQMKRVLHGRFDIITRITKES